MLRWAFRCLRRVHYAVERIRIRTRLHFGQPAQRARQIVGAFETVERRGDGLIGANEQRPLTVIENVDQPHEALQRMRCRELVGVQLVDDQPLPALGEIQIVEMRTARDAQCFETRP